MCNVHNKVNGRQALELLVEAELFNNVCEARYNYLKKQAQSYEEWSSKARTPTAYDWDKDQIEWDLAQDWSSEFLWSEFMDHTTGDSSVWASLVGGDNVKEDRIDVRLDVEEDLHDKYWGMLNCIAYKAWRATKDEPHPRQEPFFLEVNNWLDKVETEYFDPTKKYPLHRKTYNLVRKALARIKLYRFKLYILDYEHFAYLTNRCYCLLSYTERDNVTPRRLPCLMDNERVADYTHPEEPETRDAYPGDKEDRQQDAYVRALEKQWAEANPEPEQEECIPITEENMEEVINYLLNV